MLRVSATTLGGAAVGLGATLLSKLLSLKTWTLQTADSPVGVALPASSSTIQGQFPPDALTREIGGNWQSISALNRQHPVVRWVYGETDKIQMQARFFRRDIADTAPAKKMNQLIEWTKRRKGTGRPPFLRFVLGDGSLINVGCVLKGISGIQYSTPHQFGGIQQVQFTLELWTAKPFDIDAVQATDTRYHRAKEGEYYELIAAAEYGLPMLGDVVRKLPEQSGKLTLQAGSVVKLPSLRGIQSTTVEPKSIAFSGSFGKGETDQKAARLAAIDRHNRRRTSWL